MIFTLSVCKFLSSLAFISFNIESLCSSILYAGTAITATTSLSMFDLFNFPNALMKISIPLFLNS
jgi:hypothetical protein